MNPDGQKAWASFKEPGPFGLEGWLDGLLVSRPGQPRLVSNWEGIHLKLDGGLLR